MIIFKATTNADHVYDLLIAASDKGEAKDYASTAWRIPGLTHTAITVIPIGIAFKGEPEVRAGVLIEGSWRR